MVLEILEVLATLIVKQREMVELVVVVVMGEIKEMLPTQVVRREEHP